MQAWQGRLLVASPMLTDGPFHRSVVQLLEHSSDGGAVGVVLTRATLTRLGDVLPGWELLTPEPGLVHDGGPVDDASAVCLGRVPATGPSPDYRVVPGAPWLAMLDLDRDAPAPVQEVRVFAGYSGWSAGQLEQEVSDGAWWVVDALPGDPFTPAPARLWSQVLRRQGMPLALHASCPDDTSLN